MKPLRDAAVSLVGLLIIWPGFVFAQTEALETIVAAVCPSGQLGGPAMAGWVIDSETDTPIPDASVVMAWSTVPGVLEEHLGASEFSGVAKSDSVGFYVVCGVPIQTQVWLHAMSDRGLSAFYELSFVDGGVKVGDQVDVASGPVWRQDLVVLGPDERKTEVTGTVTDAMNAAPIVGADVELPGTPFNTRTDETGTFRFAGLPPGNTRVVVRNVGNDPLYREITLLPNDTLRIPNAQLALGRTPTELDPIAVEATVPVSPLAEFNARRARASGSFITRAEFERQGNVLNVTDVLRRLQGVRIEPSTNPDRELTISMRRGGPRTMGFARGGNGNVSGENCPPLFFLDQQYLGNAQTIEVDRMIALVDIEAVEAHGAIASLPMEFNRRGSQCGVIAFWTRRAQPRTVQVDSGGGFFNSTGFHAAFAIGAVVGIFFLLGENIHF